MDVYNILDTQIKDGVDISYLKSIAKHISIEKPAYLMMGGDWHDMPSLSSFEKGKKSHEVFNYIDDIEAGNYATEYFFGYLDKFWPQHKKKCKKIKLRGNHEFRIVRAFEYGDPNIREMIKHHKINDERWDVVVPFLKEYKIQRCYFSHYFPNTGSGRPLTTARQLVQKKHKTCIAYHQQGFQYHEEIGEGDATLIGIIAGACYTHDEGYIGPNNGHFRGTFIMRNVKGSDFDIERFTLKTLMKKYK